MTGRRNGLSGGPGGEETAEKIRGLACELALAAGAFLASSRPAGIGSKSTPTDLVTDADRAAEKLIVERLLAARPHDGVLGEEGALHDGSSGVRWVIDPLDGTVNYVYGFPHWCVSIGVEGSVRAGAVFDPARNELFTDGPAATAEGAPPGPAPVPLSPSSTTDLSMSLVGTGFSYSPAVRSRQAEVFTRIAPRVRDVRRMGAMALDLAWVACGRLDAFYEEDSHPWDISAGMALIESAGGVVRLHGDMVMAAGNASLYEQLEELVLGRR